MANALDEQIVKNKSPELLRKGPKIERRILNNIEKTAQRSGANKRVIRSKHTSVSVLPELTGGSNQNPSLNVAAVKSTMNLYGASRIPTKLQTKTRNIGQQSENEFQSYNSIN